MREAIGGPLGRYLVEEHRPASTANGGPYANGGAQATHACFGSATTLPVCPGMPHATAAVVNRMNGQSSVETVELWKPVALS